MVELAATVTELARFCHRSGDIDHRFGPSPTGAEGIAGHQRLYARRPDGYRREYSVSYRHSAPGLSLTLRGRADGYDEGRGLVEEIKTCRVDPVTLPVEVAALHMAQGRLYAAIIATDSELEGLDVRVTWLNIDTDEEHTVTEYHSRASLAAFLEATLSQFSDWLALIAGRRRERDRSLATLEFPYGGFRAGQRDIAELGYKCVDQGGQLLLEAPTGIGKTAALMFPALKALQREKHEKLVFVTAKTVGRRAAENALADFATAGYRGNSLSLTAKEKVCLSPGRACHADDCPYAQGYYDKLPLAMAAAMEHDRLTRQDMQDLAQRFEVCPYELALDLRPWMDVVICDVFHIYGLQAALGGTMASDSRRWTVLLDEAHNLPERARGMYSARLAKRDLMQARRAAPAGISTALERINRRFLALQKESWAEPEFDSRDSLPQGLLRVLQAFGSEVSEQLARDPALLHRHPPVMDFYFATLQFLRVAEEWGDDFRFQLSRSGGRQSLAIALNCLDPSRQLAARHAAAHALIAFSATLSPLHWARASLGLAEDAVCTRATSPFAPDQLFVEIATDLDTRYRQRQHSLPGLALRLADWLERTPGNCIVYFPSYRYMQDALARLEGERTTTSRRTWVQMAGQDEATREELLALLAEHNDVAAFCILGGVFGEGIDLPGDRLSSVVVVGVGMPQVNRDTRILQDWFQQRYGAGFEYAYLYPGMQKVDQALGRVVRREDDRGSALLIDPRYREAAYRELLPPWWTYRE